MYAISSEPLFRICRRESSMRNLRSLKSSSVEFSSFGYSLSKLVWHGRSFCNFRAVAPIAGLSGAAFLETSESTDVCFKKSFPLKRTEVEEGRIFIRLDSRKSEKLLQLTVGCNLPGKWILHWGVSFIDDVGSEWDQPPMEMRPPGSIPIKDYAIETPLRKSPSSFGGDAFYEVKIDFDPKIGIAAVNFVMKDEETGAWFQHKGRDFKVPLVNYVKDDGNVVGMKKGFDLWPGALGHLTSILRNTESPNSKDHDHESESNDPNLEISCLDGLSEELPIVKEKAFDNCISVTVTKCPDTAKNLIYMETDLPEGVVVHWGVCRNNTRKWEIPSSPHPPNTTMFKNKALRTLLQPKEKDKGCWGMFTLGEDLEAFLFVLKLNENTWLNYNGNDFYIPLVGSGSLPDLKLQVISDIIEVSDKGGEYQEASSSASTDGIINEVRNLVSDISSEKSLKTKTKEARESILQEIEKDQEASSSASTDGIINEIRNLVSDISSEKSRKTKTNEARESILQEIEKLAAEAYSIFRTSIPTFPEEVLEESETVEAPVKICSGTGSGYEILCQGFNWESNKSGRWYMELKEKAAELSALGFTVIWLPPPTESVSPEGYMPKDLYNLNSRYGKIDELKDVVKTFHKLGMKVLGDAVLNHRCAHFQNKNGVWNIFGGQLNWDDRAVVCDDPHFQGRGNKSSGDSFHAAPNIDHSQEFVRKDIKEWLCWLRKEIGYDGWRLDFVRGFWGGYVKDYLDASQPYFSVGEFWDSLSYTYNAMDHNQDAHRQRIIDWINATNGTSGAFDVTTKGILHSALERCEYWRLSDSKGKPPGVVGWWPSRAVTFIENHDTGSTQGHWRFPGGKEMQGYAYILTHPGTPSVFYDHIFSHYKSEIASLISLRNRQKIHCRSEVKITKAERDVYAAIIDEKVAMKIGPGYYQPPSGSQQWSLAIEGNNYKVWESSS